MDTAINKMPELVILWGAVGQAKLVRPIVKHFGGRIAAVFDDNPKFQSPWPETPIYYGWDALISWISERDTSDMGFIIGLGGKGRVRLELHDKMAALGIDPITLVHPSAIIDEEAEINAGSQIMAGTVIGPEVQIGRQCVINTGASVDHNCILNDGSEISPGVTLCGHVTVGIAAWVTAGATVLPMVNIGADSVVGAGSMVNRDVPEGLTVVGMPAKPLVKK